MARKLTPEELSQLQAAADENANRGIGLQFDKPRPYSLADAGVDATMGATMGAVGGGIGAAGGAVLAPAAGYVANTVERGTGSGLAGFGAGLATDIVGTVATRGVKPMTSLARAAMEKYAPGLGKRVAGSGAGWVSPDLRALGMVEDMGLVSVLADAAGPEDVAEGVRKGFQKLKDENREAWQVFEALVGPEMTTDPAAVLEMAKKLKKRTSIGKGNRQPGMLDDIIGDPDFQPGRRVDPLTGDVVKVPGAVGVQKLQDVQSAVSAQRLASAVDPTQAQKAKWAGDLTVPVRKALAEIAQMSPDARSAVLALQDARRARKAMGVAAPTQQPSVLHAAMLGPKAEENAGKAMGRIFQGKRPAEDIRRIKHLMNLIGDEKGLERSAINYMMGTIYGSSGAVRPRTAGAAAGFGEKAVTGLKEALGPGRYKSVMSFLDDVYKADTRGQTGRPIMRIAASAGVSTVSWTGAGGAAGYAIGGVPGAIGGGSAGFVIDHAIRALSPKAVRSLAYEAIADRNVLKKLMRKAGDKEGEALVWRLVESLERRGTLTAADLFGEDIQQAPQDGIRLAGEQSHVRP